MHEAALAGAVAAELREARAAGRVGRARLLVRGGHHEPVDFDASLRLHLRLAAPELDDSSMVIVHLPVARLCSDCGARFEGTGPRPSCPTCGGAALPDATPEEIELDWAAGPAA
jgi:Zn finger protein HypA/HybF involved in hydrogenase expression